MAENTTTPQGTAEQNTNPVAGADMSGAILQQLLDNAALVRHMQQAHDTMTNKVDEIQSSYSTIVQQNEALEKAYKTATKENLELKKQLEKAGTGVTPATVVVEKPKVPTEPFTIDGKKYKFLLEQWRNPRTKEVVTAIDALTDEPLLREMIARKSGAIQEVVE